MLKTAVLLASLLTAAPVLACQTTSAYVDGSIGGSSFDKQGRCLVIVSVESAKPHPICRLNLKSEDEVQVITGLSKKNCPLDEGPVHGVITQIGGNYFFTEGTIDLKNAAVK